MYFYKITKTKGSLLSENTVNALQWKGLSIACMPTVCV